MSLRQMRNFLNTQCAERCACTVISKGLKAYSSDNSMLGGLHEVRRVGRVEGMAFGILIVGGCVAIVYFTPQIKAAFQKECNMDHPETDDYSNDLVASFNENSVPDVS